MRNNPPHPLIRYRHALLAIAIAGWIIAGVTLVKFKGSAGVPVAAICGLAGLVFIWANGMYWWVLLRYPYIDLGNGNYASRDEWKGESHGAFFVIYFLLAGIGSVGCLRVAIYG
ncbi:hypothetical protein PEC18_26115 [Paucibacter sp. O1-1]|nr:hypothetical protein [Paucibacter sp. O1-1]MDA3829216.1 hypothetical protein [Paucibacter sp. O1-1]